MGNYLRNIVGTNLRGTPRRKLAVSTALVVSLAFAGFALAGSLSSTGASLTPTGPVPQTITANWGDTLTFVNADSLNNGIFSSRPELNMATIPPGSTFTTVLTGRTKTYEYSQVQNFSTRYRGAVVSQVIGSVTLKASKTSVAYGQPVTLSGKSSFGVAPVVLQQRLRGQQGFKTLQNLTPAADGAYSTTYTPKLNAAYRATVAGGQIRSGIPAVVVEPVLKTASQAKKTKANHKVTITSRLTPGSVATQITLLQCNTKRGGWRRVAAKKPSASGTVLFAWAAEAGTNYLKTMVPRGDLKQNLAPPTSNAIKIQAIAPKPKATKHPKPARAPKPTKSCS